MTHRPIGAAAVDLHLDMADDTNYQTDGSLDHLTGSTDAEDTVTSAGDPNISWPLERPNQSAGWTPSTHADTRKNPAAATYSHIVPFDELLPGHRRSLSGISSRAFFLGVTLGACVPLALYYGQQVGPLQPANLWRPFFLLATLSIFHFLEFWTHARYNTTKAEVGAFILLNGWQYAIANLLALIETTVTSLFFPDWQARFAYRPIQVMALAVLVLGQTVRSTAMATAGTNFNHQVQTRRSDDHRLVTTGIYGWLRHPSYFGFFWWAVALQIVLGNAICSCIYPLVLWQFFNSRIKQEERHLVKFFGDEYRKYTSCTRICIPFIQTESSRGPSAKKSLLKSSPGPQRD